MDHLVGGLVAAVHGALVAIVKEGGETLQAARQKVTTFDAVAEQLVVAQTIEGHMDHHIQCLVAQV